MKKILKEYKVENIQYLTKVDKTIEETNNPDYEFLILFSNDYTLM